MKNQFVSIYSTVGIVKRKLNAINLKLVYIHLFNILPNIISCSHLKLANPTSLAEVFSNNAWGLKLAEQLPKISWFRVNCWSFCNKFLSASGVKVCGCLVECEICMCVTLMVYGSTWVVWYRFHTCAAWWLNLLCTELHNLN